MKRTIPFALAVIAMAALIGAANDAPDRSPKPPHRQYTTVPIIVPGTNAPSRRGQVSQVGENSMILRDPYIVEQPQAAKIIISVDGQPRVHAVTLRPGSGSVIFFDDVDLCN